MEASDGNRHVKVYLHCPNCRSNLGPTIRDTILLRKVDALPFHDDLHIGKGCLHWQPELSPKQLEWKRAIDTDVMLLKEISDARSREAKFFEDREYHHHHDDEASGNSSSSSSNDHQIDSLYNADDYGDDEWGFEVDDALGPHETMKIPREMWYNTRDRALWIDTTLLAGFEDSMTPVDQELVTKYMTSGDTGKLATAAQLMSGIADFVYEGKTNCCPTLSSKRPSVYELIEASHKARFPLARNGSSKTTKSNFTRTPFRRRTNSKLQHHLEMERQLRETQVYMHLHPLPVRMPKYMEIQLDDLELSQSPFPLTFCDDMWDGTVMDAFSKISIGPMGHITRKRPENLGVRNVLDGGTRSANCEDVRIDTERPRVLVRYVGPEIGRKGIMKGDVLTHVNGMEVHGNVTEVESLFQTCRHTTPPKLKLVFNAERSVAEALRLRSSVKDSN
jgi:hypothetical protein